MGSSASKKRAETTKIVAVTALSPSRHSSAVSSATSKSSASSASKESERIQADTKMSSKDSDGKGTCDAQSTQATGDNDANADWWTLIDNLCADSVPVIKPMEERKTWKTVRLFISSTFKDMSNEREFLVKTIIPGLRQWCQERKLHLVECDLRWGVPKDAETNDTIMACMSELDRCREENELPYMLVMMSERYGFVPSPAEVADHIRTRYKWLPGMSVTALEEMVGGYWDLNPKVLYMIRDPSYLSQVTDPSIRGAYEEKDQKAIESLSVLKGKIREKFPDQLHEYSVQVDGVEDNKRLKFSGLDDFGKTVFRHFTDVIEKQYPADFIHEPLSSVEVLRSNQYDFVEQRGKTVYGREEALEQTRAYLAASTEGASNLLLSGPPGAGKSSLMAASVMESLQVKEYKVFFHFVGATPNSTSVDSVMTRLHGECIPTDGEKLPVDQDEMLRFVSTLFQRCTEHALSEGYTRFVVYLDALNQLDSEGGIAKLRWLPRKLPQGMRVVISSLEGECHDALTQHSETPEMVMVQSLDEALRTRIVELSLADYNKRLDDEQMEILVKKMDAGRPLYLSIACEELRVFGEFRQLTSKITSLPGDLAGLLETVLQRVIEEYGGALVEATLLLLEVSKYGLSEEELQYLLAREPLLPRLGSSHLHPTVYNEKLPMMKWALVYLGLKQFLRPCGSSDDGLLDFYHRSVSKTVRACYLQGVGDAAWYHARLIAFFQQRTGVRRRAEELPYHHVALNDMEGLRSCLLQHDVLEYLCQPMYRQQLMHYWRLLGGYGEASKHYLQFLEDLMKTSSETSPESEANDVLAMKVVWLLIDLGEFTAASGVLTRMIETIMHKKGEMAKELADPLHAMMTLLYREGLSFVYNTHPGYQKCCRLGAQYVDLCEKVHRKYFDPNDNHLGLVFSSCGYFKSSLLPEAEKIFMTNSNQQGLAIVLYMQGEKCQYDSDIGKPIEFFTRSQKLCLASFGKVHMHTARCYQLYGQLYWNRGCNAGVAGRSLIEQCLPLYERELEILEEILGPTHPTTVRSREDVIIILQTLGRDAEADVLLSVQPENNTVQ